MDAIIGQATEIIVAKNSMIIQELHLPVIFSIHMPYPDNQDHCCAADSRVNKKWRDYGKHIEEVLTEKDYRQADTGTYKYNEEADDETVGRKARFVFR